ncbi:MAG: YHS domain-containing protein [Deltaproteobacteria bacterium]|nr:YHS domain-containing protein [Deltaproteobacteria bacterium]HCH65588.1 YHS domain-containing protein [Deltaproteobacteria bacterium]
MYLTLFLVAVGFGVPAFSQSSSSSAEPGPESDGFAVEDAAANGKQTHRWNTDEAGVVMHGYDPVSYHSGTPVKGVKAHSYQWDGVTWLFSSAENRARFEASPAAYAPAMGGYCTFGVVIKKKLDGDPTVYWVHDKQLYLFLNEEVRGKFAQDQAGNLERIRENWPALRDFDPKG